MLQIVKDIKEIEKLFQTNKHGQFKKLIFNWNGETINLKGKTLETISPEETIKLKKYSTSFINNAFKEISEMK